MAKWFEVQLKSRMFDRSRPNSYPDFLFSVNGVRLEWCLRAHSFVVIPFYIKAAAAIILSKTCLTLSDLSWQKGRLTYYCQVVSLSLNRYDRDVIVSEDKADILIYNQPSDLSAVDY